MDIGIEFSYLELDFRQNGDYYLLLKYFEKENTDTLILSSGNFIVKDGNILLLSDNIHGFSMQLQIVKKTKKTSSLDYEQLMDAELYKEKIELKMEKGFVFMANRNFIETGNYQEKPVKVALTPQIQSQERESYLQSNQNKQFPLYNAVYESSNGYQLNIKEYNEYLLYHYNLLISDGIWARLGNKLILYDNALQHSFYLQITDKELISKYLPTDFSGIHLQKQNRTTIRKTDKYKPKTSVSFLDLPIHQNSNIPYFFVEQMPEFPQGDQAMQKYLKTNLRYPDAAKKAGTKGNVILRFVVEKDGSLSQIKVAKSLSPECDAEAIRLVKAMPKWIPGKHDGKTVAVWYTLPIFFPI
jgi:TonB family protein